MATLHPAEASAAARSAYRKIGLRLLPLLFLAYVFNYLDRVNVGFAQLQMSNDLQFSATVYGLGAGVFFIGYFLFEVPSNLLLQKFGARVWIARIMISWGVLSALLFLTTSPWQFYLIRFLLGLAEAGFFPGVILYLTYWYGSARRARATAFFFTAVALSGVIGGPVSGVVLQGLDEVAGLHGWQWMFLLEGTPAVLVGVAVLVWLPSVPARATWLTPEERAAVETELAAEDVRKPVHGSWDALRDRKVLRLAAVYFCYVLGSYGIAFWLPQVIRAAGVTDLVSVGLLSAIPWGVAAVAMVLSARSSDRTRRRRLHVTVAAGVGAAGLLVVGSVGGGHVVPTMLGLVLATAGVFSALPLFWSLPSAFLAAGAAAVGLAAINSIGNLAGFLSNFMVGWLVDATGSPAVATIALACFLLAGMALTLTIPRAAVDR